MELSIVNYMLASDLFVLNLAAFCLSWHFMTNLCQHVLCSKKVEKSLEGAPIYSMLHLVEFNPLFTTFMKDDPKCVPYCSSSV